MNTMTTPTLKRDPWSWIPTLYFAEGLPYVAVMTIAVIMYKRLGLSNTEIALYIHPGFFLAAGIQFRHS